MVVAAREFDLPKMKQSRDSRKQAKVDRFAFRAYLRSNQEIVESLRAFSSSSAMSFTSEAIKR